MNRRTLLSHLPPWLLRLMAPGYSTCLACERPWLFVEPHATQYEIGNGWSNAMFPLCEECWAARSPEERLPFYRRLCNLWLASSGNAPQWAQVEQAVRSEL